MIPPRTETISFPAGDAAAGALLMDLHRPPSSGPHACVLWVHGGGWFTGDRTLCPDLPALAEATGLVFASLEYRLSGDAVYPAPYDDVCAALDHLVDRAGVLGVDSDRLGLWGASAGAHLAALAALRWGGRRVSAGGAADAEASGDRIRVRAAALGYPPADLRQAVDDALARRPGADVMDLPEARLLGEDPRTSALAEEASPLSHVTSSSGSSAQAPPVTPAFQIAHGQADALVAPSHSERLHDALEATGHSSELHLLERYRHGFLNPAGRMDVEMAAVMDDGRLEQEGRAACRTRRRGVQTAGHFGFPDITRFLTQHLVPSTSHPSTTRPSTTRPSISP